MPDRAAQLISGLVSTETHAPIPLEGIRVEATVRDFCSRVTVSQRFRNREAQPIEAVYVFPLDEGAAVCAFEAVIGGVRVVGHVEEKEKAFARYDDAIAAGHGAYLLDQERPDVFTASIGNLPPGGEVLVRVSYVAELGREGDSIRFALPTTVSPRYAPPEDQKGVGRTPALALNPPVAWTVPYGLEIRATFEMASAIRSLESPSHPVRVEVDGRRATVGLAARESALDRDFVLKIDVAEPHLPRSYVETAPGGETVALIAFEPRFASGTGAGEMVFLVDRSGSMQGSSIAEARNALQLCLRSLRPGWTFNVVGFGDRFETLFPESRPYDEATLSQAARVVEGIDANMGGTNILPALEAILQQRIRPGYPRQLFILTDGQVTNTEAVIALVRKHSADTRVFTFGVGAGASAHLVRGIARAGEGEAEFIHPGERIEAKVMRQLKRAMAPALTDVTVDWGGLEVRSAPHRLSAVFDGGRVLAYGFLPSGAVATEVTLRARGPEGPVAFTTRVEPGQATADTLLATLAARAMIRDLEEGQSPLHDRRGSLQDRAAGRDRVTAEIVRLGVAYGLCSRATSFVAVEEREAPLEAEAVLRRVPVALTSGWGGTDETLLRSLSLAGSPLDRSSREVIGAATRFSAPASAAPGPVGRAFRILLGKDVKEAPAATDREAPVHSSAVRPFDRLVALQRADGSWDLSEALAEVIGIPLDRLARSVAGVAGDAALARRAWATALALRWLEKNSRLREEWAMLADKAEAWLKACGAPAAGIGGWEGLAASVLN